MSIFDEEVQEEELDSFPPLREVDAFKNARDGFGELAKSRKFSNDPETSLIPVLNSLFGKYGLEAGWFDSPKEYIMLPDFGEDEKGETLWWVDLEGFRGIVWGRDDGRGCLNKQKMDIREYQGKRVFHVPDFMLLDRLSTKLYFIANFQMAETNDEKVLDDFFERLNKFLFFCELPLFTLAYKFFLLCLRRGKDYSIDQKNKWYGEIAREYGDRYDLYPDRIHEVYQIKGNEDGFLNITYETSLATARDILFISVPFRDKELGEYLQEVVISGNKNDPDLKRYVYAKLERARRRGAQEDIEDLNRLLVKAFGEEEKSQETQEESSDIESKELESEDDGSLLSEAQEDLKLPDNVMEETGREILKMLEEDERKDRGEYDEESEEYDKETLFAKFDDIIEDKLIGIIQYDRLYKKEGIPKFRKKSIQSLNEVKKDIENKLGLIFEDIEKIFLLYYEKVRNRYFK
jgi:hypothetical protein